MTDEEYLLYCKEHNIDSNPKNKRKFSRLDYMIYCYEHGFNPEPNKNGEGLRKVSWI